MKLTDLITPEELKAAALEMEGYGGPHPKDSPPGRHALCCHEVELD